MGCQMLDNILVASRSLSEHARHLRIVLSRLQQHGLVLNAEKCEWAQVSLSYLGHEVSASGVKPLTYRVAAIQLFLLPPTVQLLQTYLGMVNFYLRFLRGATQILKPLTDCLKGGGQGSAGLDRRHVDSFRAQQDYHDKHSGAGPPGGGGRAVTGGGR